jgi:hypothetical protein
MQHLTRSARGGDAMFITDTTSYPIIVVGRVTRATPTVLWTNHLPAFKINGIPTEIDTQELQYSTKKQAPWVKASYSDISRGNLPATKTDTMIANTSAQEQEHNIMGPGQVMDITDLNRKLIVQEL